MAVDKVELRVGSPIHEYIPGLGTVTIIRQGLRETLMVIEERPDDADGTVRGCLEEWVRKRRRALADQAKDVDTVEILIALIKAQGG